MARRDRPNIFYGVTLHLWNAAQWTKTHKKGQICFEICFELDSIISCYHWIENNNLYKHFSIL